ncbi:MAG: prolipoprotein diacylglyceryl transferase [Patescibacteria group bacterium]|jgi:phosphatidylglycerol:prolipoprotein diacylglycerol transferase
MRGQLWWIKLALGAIFIGLIGWWVAPYFSGRSLINPVWLTVGSIQLYWYGLLMTIGIFSGFGLVFWLNRQLFQLNSDHLFYSLVSAVIGGFIGARLVFVILAWPIYVNNLDQIWQIHSGGMSIHGGILGGLLGLWAGSRMLKIDFSRLVDLCAIALPLGQAIGRWGNFFNQEAFGGPTDLSWKMFVAPEFRPVGLTDQAFYHPTFLYEATGSLIIFWLLWRLIFRRPQSGTVALWYLILYSSWRFIMEYFRIDSQQWNILTIAQWASLAIVVVAVILLNRRRNYGN